MPESLFPDDHLRPRYHFLPPRNWMNDPNGLIHYDGRYHLFYQYNPTGPLWGSISWGHAMSTDLVQWKHMPIALRPDADGVDADGCYSGAMVIHDGVPTIIYTGVRKPDELPCLAMSQDADLSSWATYAGNPVIQRTPRGVNTTIFRDHTLWREGSTWMMGVGSGIEGKGGAVLLFRSSDLVTWEYLHPLAVEDPTFNPTGKLVSTGWECPDFFFLGGEPVLVACEWDGDPIAVSYWTGQYEHHRFTAKNYGMVDAGSSFYAPQSFQDQAGRRIMIGWLREERADEALIEAGWAGVMSLPRVVSRRDDGTLAFAPADEIRTLRGDHQRVSLADGVVPLNGIRGNSCELLLRIDEMPDSRMGVEVLRSLDGRERTVIAFDPEAGDVTLDTERASADERVTGTVSRAACALEGNKGLTLRIFVDRSVVEIYVNDEMCLTGRAYPSVPTQDALGVINPGAVPGHIDVWDMADVMP